MFVTSSATLSSAERDSASKMTPCSLQMAWHFFGELSAFLLAVRKDSDEAAGSAEKAINGPRSEDGAFVELARPVKAEDAGGYVTEDGDLVGAKFHT